MQTVFNICKKPTYVYKEQCVLALSSYKIEAYLVLCQTPKMESFAKAFNSFKPIIILAKSSILDL